MENDASRAAGPVVEQFAGNASRWLGVFVIVVTAVLSVWVLVSNPGRDLDAVGAAVGLALLSWVVLVRPVVAVHQRGLLLRNMLRDTFIPPSQIDRCRVFQTLQVATPTRHYHGLGVGRSARSIARSEGGPLFGGRGLAGWSMNAGAQPLSVNQYAQEQVGGSYTEYVESRIERLGAEAKPDAQEPIVAWVWPSVVALVVAAGCFVALFI